MLESIVQLILNNLWTILGVAGIGGLLGIMLKKYVSNDFIIGAGKKARWAGKALGVLVTGGLSKWKYTKPVWNKIIEPYVIVIFKTIALNFQIGVIEGLESDNASLSDD